ncbi:MAG: magnesium transporter [bacterium]
MFHPKDLLLKIEENIDFVLKQHSETGKELWEALLHQHPADIATLITRIKPKKQEILFKKLSQNLMINVFAELPLNIQLFLLNKLDTEQITSILQNIHTDKLTEILDELPDQDFKKYLSLLQKKQRHQIISLLHLSPHAAGRLMNSEVLTLNKDLTVKRSITLLQRLSAQKELLRRIYVTTKDNKLVGYINLDDLVLNKPDETLNKILHPNELCIDVHEDQEWVAKQMQHYGLISVPVIDKQHHFLGVITADDVFDVITEESSEDVYKMSAVPTMEYTYFETPVWTLFWQRGIWLVSLLLLQTISSFIMSNFSQLLDDNVILTFFLTALIGTGGNAGNQSSAILIRGLATGEINKKNGLWALLREMSVSFILSILLVIVMFFRVYFYHPNVFIAIAVSATLFFIVNLAILLGSALPLIFEKLNIDPAHTAAPFLATLMDILGVLIYCFIASKILGA